MISLLFLFTFSFSDYGPCSQWKKDPIVHCYFTNKKAQVWRRNCSHYYDIREICSTENPNQFRNGCSEWLENRNFTCFSNEGLLERQWLRTCFYHHRATQFCSDTMDPNEFEL